MTGNSCLLDTSIIIHSFKNIAISKQFDSFTDIFVPSIVVGELYFGAYRSGNPTKHILQIQSFFQNCIILGANEETGNLYGSIKTKLMAKGKPIPENDLWISAIAIQYSLPLFTIDKHFAEIESIVLI